MNTKNTFTFTFTTRKEYQIFVSDWRNEYKELSQLIRETRQEYKEAQRDNNLSGIWTAVNKIFNIQRPKARYMLEQRAAGKIAAQHQYMEQHLVVANSNQ